MIFKFIFISYKKKKKIFDFFFSAGNDSPSPQWTSDDTGHNPSMYSWNRIMIDKLNCELGTDNYFYQDTIIYTITHVAFYKQIGSEVMAQFA